MSRRPAPLIQVLLLFFAAVLSLNAQSTHNVDEPHGIAAFLANWDARAHNVEAEQPSWLTPAVTSTSRIKQEFRYDMSWQSSPTGVTQDNYGGSKGFTTIPVGRVEISINPPPYIVHKHSASADGFGDFSVVAKFRIISASREHGDYELTVFIGSSFPTASHKNGSANPVITPTIAGGKGIGDFVFQGTFGCDLPSSQTALAGRRFVFNNALQYRRWRKFWPEMEVNSNFYSQGPNDGKKQVYLTPGISAGRFPIHGPFSLTIAAGTEFAVTHFHSAARQTAVSVRLPF